MKNITLYEALEKDSKARFLAQRLVMSFSEVMNLYEGDELIINPNYQRSFRWSEEKQTAFLESILLGIPTPSIFVFQKEDGVWELVDGLQRVSTILHFFGKLKQEPKKLVLKTGKIISDLKGKTIDDISAKARLRIKRANCSVEVLEEQDDIEKKYELFNRLNTTSEPLKPYEIRNAIYTGKFIEFINQLAKEEYELIASIIEPSENEKKNMHLQENILLYFALQDSIKISEKGINEHLNNFLSKMKNTGCFDYEKEKNIYLETLKTIKTIDTNPKNKILKGNNGRVIKALYAVLTYKIANDIREIKKIPNDLKGEFLKFKGSDELKEIQTTKRGTRLQEAIKLAQKYFPEK